MKLLVTGGTGLIGVHTIARLLGTGCAVRALVRDPDKLARCLAPFDQTRQSLEVVTGDVTDTASVAAAVAGCDAAIHCAGVFSNRQEDAAWLRQTNVTGTETVLREAVAAGLDPVIYVSSYLALFPPIADVMRADDPVTHPRMMYARTKAEAETLARQWQDQGAPVVTVYPGSVQGPHDPTYGIGSQLIEQAIRRKRWLVTGARGYTDVRDLAQLLESAARPGLGPRRYMFGGYYLSDEEVRRMLCDISGREISAQKIPGWVLRAIGTFCDAITSITGKPYELTREAAEVLTRSVPTDDNPAIEELGLELVGAEQSFRDLVEWMVASGKLPASGYLRAA